MSDVDEVQAWVRSHDRVSAWAAGWSADEAATTVPATPDWTCHDLLAHMIGLDADVLAGAEPDDHSEDWTWSHVEDRAGRDVAALLAEWAPMRETLPAWMREHGTRPLGDVYIHEQDLRGALGAPGARDDDAVVVLRDRFADRVGTRIDDAGLPPVRLSSPGWTSDLGGDGDPAVVVEAPAFDLFRLLVARRSAAQVQAWTARGDVGPYLPLLGALGPLRDEDLVE